MKHQIGATFALFVYNQQRYVEEAVRGAMEQTYRPLQIIISDDASTDNSVAIIRRVVSEYQSSAEVLINVNENNLGLCAHVNRVMELTAGELSRSGIFGWGDIFPSIWRIESVNAQSTPARHPGIASMVIRVRLA